ncbi:MAG: type II secretion system protein, partial [Betaproteobacteria bacterium]
MSSAVRAWLCAKPLRRGFTLLEVLVALAIIGVALAAALRGALA